MLTYASSALAQGNQCTMTLADLPQPPDLLGFRLGMTTEQVKLRIPQVVFGRADEFGVSKTSINPHFDPRIDKTDLEDVRTISLDFLDGQLTSLWIGYESTFKWSTVEDHVKGISVSLSLPNAWVSWKLRGQELRCSDFHIIVTAIAGGSSFRIVDKAAEDLIAARRIAKAELEEIEESSEDDAVVGNRKTRIYYPAGCTTEAIPDSDRVVFRTIEEAEQAGYKRFTKCP